LTQRSGQQLKARFVALEYLPILEKLHPFLHMVEILADVPRESKYTDEDDVTGLAATFETSDDSEYVVQSLADLEWEQDREGGLVVPDDYIQRDLDPRRLVLHRQFSEQGLARKRTMSMVDFGSQWVAELKAVWCSRLAFEVQTLGPQKEVSAATLLHRLRLHLTYNDAHKRYWTERAQAEVAQPPRPAPVPPRPLPTTDEIFTKSLWLKPLNEVLCNLHNRLSAHNDHPQSLPLRISGLVYDSLAALYQKQPTLTSPQGLNSYHAWNIEHLEEWMRGMPRWIPAATLVPFARGAWEDIRQEIQRYEYQDVAAGDIARLMAAVRVLGRRLEWPNAYALLRASAVEKRQYVASRNRLPPMPDFLRQLRKLIRQVAPWSIARHDSVWSYLVPALVLYPRAREPRIVSTATALCTLRTTLQFDQQMEACDSRSPPSIFHMEHKAACRAEDLPAELVMIGQHVVTKTMEVAEPGREYKRLFICDRTHVREWATVASYMRQPSEHRIEFLAPWSTIVQTGGVCEQSVAMARAIRKSWTEEDRKRTLALCLPISLACQMRQCPDSQSDWNQEWNALKNLGPVELCTCLTVRKMTPARLAGFSRLVLPHAEMLTRLEWLHLVEALRAATSKLLIHVLFTPIGNQPVTPGGMTMDGNSVALLLDMPWLYDEDAMMLDPLGLDAVRDLSTSLWERQMSAWLQMTSGREDSAAVQLPSPEDLVEVAEEEQAAAVLAPRAVHRSEEAMDTLIKACHARLEHPDQPGQQAHDYKVTHLNIDALCLALPVHPRIASYLNEFYRRADCKTIAYHLDRLNQPHLPVAERVGKMRHRRGSVELHAKLHPLRLLTLLCYWPAETFDVSHLGMSWQDYRASWMRRPYCLTGPCPQLPMNPAMAAMADI
jgi:hypothetical protein